MLTKEELKRLADGLNAHPELWQDMRLFLSDAQVAANDETTAAAVPAGTTREYLAGYEQGLKEVREALQAVKERDGTMFPQLQDVERRENEEEEEEE
jgi:hypothetical protein